MVSQVRSALPVPVSIFKKNYSHLQGLKPESFFRQHSVPIDPRNAGRVEQILQSQIPNAARFNYYQGKKASFEAIDFFELCSRCQIINDNIDDFSLIVNWIESIYREKPEIFFKSRGDMDDNANYLSSILQEIYLLDGLYKNELYTNPRNQVYKFFKDPTINQCIWIATPHLAQYFKIPATMFDSVATINGRYTTRIDGQSCSFLPKEFKLQFMEEIISGYFDESSFPESEEPELNIVCGPVGSGKSTLISQLGKVFVISPDDVKQKLALMEIDGKRLGNACANHELSISIGLEIFRRAISTKPWKIVFETTGTYSSYLIKLAREARSCGYKVKQHLLTLHPLNEQNLLENLQQRIVKRYERDLETDPNARFADPLWANTGSKHIHVSRETYHYFDKLYAWTSYTSKDIPSKLGLVSSCVVSEPDEVKAFYEKIMT
ncbi:MAG: zeta toxin family protein [Candidatus Caenarcaniphilales bacterium]|nr:zeta toxin family protein [Candidatus Caenarcaniphilales bacterium]